METIYKYQLEQKKVQTLSIPADAEILDIQRQFNEVWAWVRLDTDKPERERTIVIYGTGHEIEPAQMKHLKTLQVDGFVWHFFEVL